ncbi:MAG: hypothetical protein RR248_05710 [Clostridia bacterium]
MKRSFKSFISSALVSLVLISSSGCSSNNPNPNPDPGPNPNPDPPPPIDIPVDKVALKAPKIEVNNSGILKLTPNASSEKDTTGYLVSINGRTQTLNESQRELTLTPLEGGMTIEVSPLGGKDTIATQKSSIILTAEQSESIAFYRFNNLLKEKLSVSIDFNVVSIDSMTNQDGKTKIMLTFKCDSVIFQEEHILTNLYFDDNQNIFEMLNSLETLNSDLITKKKVLHTKKDERNVTNDLLINGYLNGNNKNASVSALADFVNQGWQVSYLYNFTTPIRFDPGGEFGDMDLICFNTEALVKLTKNGEAPKFLNVKYEIKVDQDIRYPFEDIISGILNAKDIIISKETIVYQSEICGTFNAVKENHENAGEMTIVGKIIETPNSNVSVFQQNDGNSYVILNKYYYN